MPGSAGRRSSAVVRCLVPFDVASSGPGRGDGDAGLDGDLDGVGSDGNRDGLAGVGQADLDSLTADHDGSADGDPPGDDEGAGRRGGWAVPGRAPRSRGPGLGRDGAGDSADQDPGVAPKAELDLGSFRASLLTSTRSVSTIQVILIALIWVAIAVVNVAYARRHPGRP
jgi:hypothetical protein